MIKTTGLLIIVLLGMPQSISAQGCKHISIEIDATNLSPEYRLLLKKCYRGEGAGCIGLGIRFAKGVLVLKNARIAGQLYEKACYCGEYDMCYSLGVMYIQGEGYERDEKKAFKLLNKACHRGVMSACTSLSIMFEYGKGVVQDMKQAQRLIRKACDGGDHQACIMKDGVVKSKPVPSLKEYVLIAKRYRKECDRENMRACAELGLQYYFGNGVQKNGRNAINLLGKACNGGYAKACYSLATIYREGSGVKKDLQKSIDLYNKGCEAGDTDSCFEQGNAHLRLFSGNKEWEHFNVGLNLLRKACAQYNVVACQAWRYWLAPSM